MLKPGTLLQGRYRVIHQIGGGGQALVYQAEDTNLGSLRAVKELTPDANASPQERQAACDQLQHEARILAGLNHPNLARVWDHFRMGDNAYLVMDHIEGQTLQEIVDQTSGFLSEAAVLRWAGQLCDVLDYLHRQHPPIIFRDLKPSNVMLDRTDTVKLIDFGIVRHFKAGQVADTLSMGTPGYAPLEQHGRGQTDARSDIYALGATLYHLLTRREPEPAPDRALPTQPDFVQPVRAHNPKIKPSTEVALAKAMAVDPIQRFQSALEMKQALIGAPTVRHGIQLPWFLLIGLAVLLFGLEWLLAGTWFTATTKARITATAQAQETATAIAQAAATAQAQETAAAIAQTTATAQAQKTATARARMTATAQAQRTATAAVQATATAQAQKTATAIARMTATAQAQRTATAVAQATATAQAQKTAAARARATATAQAQETATARARATATAASATATTVACIHEVALAPSHWSIIMCDPFNTNVNDWDAGDYSSELSTGSRLATDGKYRWEVEAHKSAMWWSNPTINSASDLYLTVEARRVSGPQSSSYGVLFRQVDEDFYAFEMSDAQQFSFSLYHQGQWMTLIGWTESSAIRPGEVNRMTVLGEGSHFSLYINDQYVGEAEDDQLSKGEVGLTITLYNAGDEAVFEFDKFEVRAP